MSKTRLAGRLRATAFVDAVTESAETVAPPECGECNDALAVTKRTFAGATVVALCDGCATYWDEHRLDGG